MSYIVYSLPRSRSYWLSRFLSYGDWHCSHDELLHMRSMEDVQSWLAMPNTGTVETLAAPFWRLVKHLPTVVIRRSVDEVLQSLEHLGMAPDRKIIQRYDDKLNQIEDRMPNALSVNFNDLIEEKTCRSIFEFVLPYDHDHDWWQLLAGMNLQSNIQHTMRYYAAHQPQLNKLAKVAKHRCIAEISTSLCDNEVEGFTIQQEPFDKAYTDGQKMYADHCALVGEAPDSYMNKNLNLMRTLESNDSLIVTTARSNGRLFGYLVAVISPSLESPNITGAVHTMFFTDPCVKGLGMKLQRASVTALRERGVNELYFHAGVRASGPRMGTIFRRLGASEFGQVYKLDLNS